MLLIEKKCKHCSSSCKKTADSNASCSMIYHALTFFGQAEYYANSCIRSAQIPFRAVAWMPFKNVPI